MRLMVSPPHRFTSPFSFPLLPALLLLIAPVAFAAALLPGAARNGSPADATVTWRTDLERAREESLTARKPLLLVFRCQLRPAQAGLDTRDGAELDPELAHLIAERFVPVRITSIKDVDLERFRFDYDLQFAVLVYDGRDEATLARWGTRDAVSDTARLSPVGLIYTLRQAAEAYATRRPGPSPLLPRRRTALDYPVFARSKRAQEPCWHCHYAEDARLAQARQDGTFTKAMLFRYPLPENIGVILERDRGNRVQSIVPHSPADVADVRVNDVLLRMDQTPIYSTADLQFALDRVPGSGKIMLVRSRAGKTLPPVTLTLPAGWRETDISWRASQGGVPPFLGTWEKSLTTEEKRALGIPADRLALRITTLFSGPLWEKSYAGLQVGDVIVAANGAAPPAMNARQFHAWYRIHGDVGKTLILTVLRDGKRVEVPLVGVDVPWLK